MTSRIKTGGGGGGGGAASSVTIKDGVDGAILATVTDLAASNPLNVAIVDGAGNQVTSFGGTGGTSMTDDAAFTPGTTAITPVGGTYRSVRDAVDDNDGGVFAMNAKRGMYVSIETPASDSAMDDTLNTLNVSIPAGAVASGAILSGAVASGAIASGAVASGAIASGAVASGAVASGAVASGAFAAGSIAAGAVAAGALSFVKLEDVASAGGDAGVPAMAIQLATPADTAADGDYAMLQMSAGRLWGSVKVDTALPAGNNNIGDVDVASVTGNVTVVQGTSTNLKADITIAAAQTLATVTTVGTVSAVTAITNALPAGNNNIGDVDVASVTGNVTVVQGTSTNLKADVTIAAAQTLATVTTVGTVTTVSTLTGGAVADDSADSGNPIKVGGKAQATPSTATMITDADRANLVTDVDNALRVKGWTTGKDLLSASQSVTDTTSTAVTGFTAVASTKNFITSVTVHNAHATTNGFLKLQDGSGGTTIWVFPLPATGGATHNFNPPLKQPTAATALYFAASASITTVYVSINGFQSKAY